MARCHPPASVHAVVPMATLEVLYTLVWHVLRSQRVRSPADAVNT